MGTELIPKRTFFGLKSTKESVKNYRIVKTGDLIYTKSPIKGFPNGIIRSNKGNVGIVPPLYCVYTLQKDINSSIIQLYFEDKNRLDLYLFPLVNVGARNNVNITDLEFLEGKVTIPKSYEEQSKIVQFMEQLNTTIALHQRKLDLLKEQKKGYLQKMFPKNGEKVPELRFAGLADDWELRKLGEVYNFQYGQFNNNPDNGGQYPIYGANGIIGGYDEYNSENAIVIGHMGAYAGHVLWAEGKHFVTYNGTMGIADKSILNSNFGYYLVVSVNVPKLTAGSGQPFVSYSDLNGIKILIPTIEEQQKIGSFFKQRDNTIALHQLKLDLLKEQNKFFLHNFFLYEYR